jgi:hypothetical protein
MDRRRFLLTSLAGVVAPLTDVRIRLRAPPPRTHLDQRSIDGIKALLTERPFSAVRRQVALAAPPPRDSLRTWEAHYNHERLSLALEGRTPAEKLAALMPAVAG